LLSNGQPKAVLWLRQLGGKLGIPTDRDGNYWLLQGISAVIVTCSTLSFVFLRPFLFRNLLVGNHYGLLIYRLTRRKSVTLSDSERPL
jgi:hypothetical protein